MLERDEGFDAPDEAGPPDEPGPGLDPFRFADGGIFVFFGPPNFGVCTEKACGVKLCCIARLGCGVKGIGSLDVPRGESRVRGTVEDNGRS